jgi:hypothetical protein
MPPVVRLGSESNQPIEVSDALWNNHLIGPSCSQGMFDNESDTGPQPPQLTYEVYFYGNDPALAPALEFDVNQFFGNMSLIFGHECRIASGNQWEDQNARWVPAGCPLLPEQQLLESSYDQGAREHRTTIWCISPSASIGSPAILTGPSAMVRRLAGMA